MAVNEIRYKGVSYATDDDIKVPSGILYEVKALRSDSLEANSLTVTVFSSDKAIMGFAKNDKVEYFRDGRRVGVYYLQTVERVGSDAYTLSALSALGRLITMRHVGGIYTGQTVAEVVPQICGPVAVMIESVYASRKLYGYLPYSNPDTRTGNGRSARDNLSQVLFAIGASLGTDENGVMRVEKLWDGVSATITADQINEDSCSTVYETPVSAVEITEHQWVKSQDTVTLFEGTAEDGALVTFEDPAHSLTAEGFTITEQGDNYAILSAGTGTLTGKSYNHLTRIVRRTVTDGAEENVVTVSDATLVSLTNSVDVAKRMADYYRHREIIRVNVEPGTERAGRVVQIFHPWDKKMVQACVESRETVISGILNSQTSALVGFKPAQPDASEYFDAREELTKDGEWTSPTGEFTAVLIGGAWGGFSGKQGASGGTTGKTYSSSGVSTKNQGMMASKGGDGGEAGLGGSGGRILQISVTCDPGTKFSIHIGKGGAGGGHSGSDSVQGSEGSATTFGTYTSADGAASNAGYLDLITGEVYAARGAAGIPGGKGGGTKDNATAGDDEPNEPGGSVVDDSGTVWLPGATPQPPIPIKSYLEGAYDSNREKAGDLYAGAGPGIGGGAAVGANGSDGDKGYGRVRSTSQVGWGDYSITCNGGTGGKGADAVAPDKVAGNRGTGGRGGHGGGGGGGFGICEASSRIYTGHSLSITYNVNAGTPGQGGNGSDGGEGGDGCVLIYYSKLRTIQTGPLATADGKWLLDKLGRRMIV